MQRACKEWYKLCFVSSWFRLRGMADNGFEWATRHNLVRTSPVHGEQEAKLVLEDGFSFNTVEGETTQQSTRLEVEEPCLQLGCYVDTCTNPHTPMILNWTKTPITDHLVTPPGQRWQLPHQWIGRGHRPWSPSPSQWARHSQAWGGSCEQLIFLQAPWIYSFRWQDSHHILYYID